MALTAEEITELKELLNREGDISGEGILTAAKRQQAGDTKAKMIARIIELVNNI